MHQGVAMKLVVPGHQSAGWSAGSIYVEAAARCIRMVASGDSIDLQIVCANKADAVDRWAGLATPISVPGPRLWHRALSRLDIPVLNSMESYCLRNDAQALLLAHDITARRVPFRRIPWIPDFQHKYLPRFFSQAERDKRDAVLETCTRYGDALICSSESVRDDYQRYYPQYAHKARVARFPSLFVFKPPAGLPAIKPAEYGLPEKFILVVNQYWAHKNFEVVLEALSTLAKNGVVIPCVFTGLPVDWRSPLNEPVSNLLQAIASKRLAGQVLPLGFVPREHLTALMRTAALMVQPSRFEGWSTCVQDAKALGRPLICSDLPVHREQAPGCLGFFDCDDSKALADILDREWPTARPGPDSAAEKQGIIEQKTVAMTFGRTLLEMCGS